MNKRNSSFELLRIVSMLMIIGLHYFNGNMGGGLQYIPNGHFNYYIMYFLESSCIVGVGSFVLITGYFQVNKRKADTKKVIYLILLMMFYGAFFYLLLLLTGVVGFSSKELIASIAPFLLGRRWFVRTYIILYLLSPYLNVVLQKLNGKQYRALLAILLIFFSLWPSFLPGAPNNDGGYGIITFILFYCIGGYLRKHYNSNRSFNYYMVGYLLTTIMTTLFSLYLSSGKGWGYNFIFNVMGSTFLFLAFSKLKLSSVKIDYIASFAFVAFLIHSDFSLNQFLYKTILKTQLYYESKYFVVHFLACILFMYGASMIIDLGRRIIVNKISKIIIINDKIKNFNCWLEKWDVEVE